MTSCLMAIAMFVIFLTVCEILAKQENCQNFGFENYRQCQGVEERDLRHSTGNAQIIIGDFQNFSFLGT